MGPVSLRRFRKLLRIYGCNIMRTSTEWQVVDSEGKYISGFAIAHGRRTKGNEVKPIYVQKFLKKIQERNS